MGMGSKKFSHDLHSALRYRFWGHMLTSGHKISLKTGYFINHALVLLHCTQFSKLSNEWLVRISSTLIKWV